MIRGRKPAGGGVHNPPSRRAVYDQRTYGSVGAGAGNRPGYPMYARHDQRLGGESPLWRLMAPTTSRRQLLLREEGGKEAGDEVATLGTHGLPSWWWRAARMRRGGPGEPARHGEALCPSRGRHVDAVGARGRPLVLFGEISTGVPDAHPRRLARSLGGAGRRCSRGRRSPRRSQQRPYYQPGSLMVAGKGRTRSRAPGRSCS